MRRVVFAVLAVLSLCGGLATLIPGALAGAAFGSDGTVSASPSKLQTPTAALVIPSAGITTPGLKAGGARLEFTTESLTKPAFVGIGRTADVDRYFNSTTVDEVREFNLTNDNFTYKTVRRGGGSPAALPDPTTQSFWVAKATGTGKQRLSWERPNGDYEIVVMNADGSTGLDQHVGASLHLSFIWSLALILMVFGAVLLPLAVLFLVLAVRSRSRPVQPAAAM